jgi:hypothetical protein
MQQLDPNRAMQREEVLTGLRRNDSGFTKVDIDWRGAPNDEELLEALQSNQHVKDLALCLDEMGTDSNWESLLRVIAMRENLENVDLTKQHVRAEKPS